MRFLRVDTSIEPNLVEVMELTNNNTLGSQPRGYGQVFRGELPDWAKAHMTILNIAIKNIEPQKACNFKIDGVGIIYTPMQVYRLVPPEGVKL